MGHFTYYSDEPIPSHELESEAIVDITTDPDSRLMPEWGDDGSIRVTVFRPETDTEKRQRIADMTQLPPELFAGVPASAPAASRRSTNTRTGRSGTTAPAPTVHKRDRWGRPLIIPLDVNTGQPDPEAKPVPFTRVSTMAKTLDDTSNLMAWKQRVTALGLAVRPDLMMRLHGIIATHDDPLNDYAAKGKLREVVTEADEAGGGSRASSTGTGYHELTEAFDRGRPLPAGLPDEVQHRLNQYAEARMHLKVLDKEVFVVNDELQAAGSFDTLVYCPDGMARIDDLKTGKDDPRYALKVCIQEAIYANSSRYDPETGERTPIHDDLDVTRGILTHMPAKADGTHLYWLDLEHGWAAAQAAADVFRIRKWRNDDLCWSMGDE